MLIGWLDVHVAAWAGMTLKGLSLHRADDEPGHFWVAAGYTTGSGRSGQPAFYRAFSFAGAEWLLFRSAVLDALRAAHPEAFEAQRDPAPASLMAEALPAFLTSTGKGYKELKDVS